MRSSIDRRWLIVMAKQPRAGLVKTRLARDVGTAAATNFYRHASAAVIARLSATKRWQVVLAVTPDAAIYDRAWPHRLPRVPQGPGDLGRRMQRVIDGLPPGPAIVIGTDIPGITPAHVARAFAALGSHDAVFGPATDGGYWLVGMARRRPLRGAFVGVRLVEPVRSCRHHGKSHRHTARDRRPSYRCR